MVYHILRWESLVKQMEYQLAYGKEYRHKFTGSQQVCATHASYLEVVIGAATAWPL